MRMRRSHIHAAILAWACDGSSAAASPPAISDIGGLLIPVDGVVASELRDSFGDQRHGHAHEAIDIAAARGTKVFAVDDGKLVKLFKSVPGGLTIYQYDLLARFAYYYAHLDGYAPGITGGDGIASRRSARLCRHERQRSEGSTASSLRNISAWPAASVVERRASESDRCVSLTCSTSPPAEPCRITNKSNAQAGRALDRLLKNLADDHTVSVIRAFSIRPGHVAHTLAHAYVAAVLTAHPTEVQRRAFSTRSARSRNCSGLFSPRTAIPNIDLDNPVAAVPPRARRCGNARQLKTRGVGPATRRLAVAREIAPRQPHTNRRTHCDPDGDATSSAVPCNPHRSGRNAISVPACLR